MLKTEEMKAHSSEHYLLNCSVLRLLEPVHCLIQAEALKILLWRKLVNLEKEQRDTNI